MKQYMTWIVIGLGFAVLVIGFLTVTNFLRLNAKENFEIKLSAAIEKDKLSESEKIVIAEAQLAAEEAGQAVDLAFNLLGIFEALSLAITVGAGAAAVVGLTRFTAAQTELEETRRVIEKEFEEARERFETAITERETELIELRQELQQDAQDDRQRTADALLANALIPIGERQYRTSDYQGALTTYNRALSLDAENPVINQRLAYVYIQSGEINKAKEHYERAIEREQDFAPALAGLGFVYRRLGEKVSFEGLSAEERDVQIIERDQLFNRSEDLLLQALKLSPKLVDDDGESYWGILGSLYKRRGQIEQAIEAYEKVTEVTPQSSYGYGNLALLYQKTGEREKMLATYKIVEQIASKEAEAEAGNFWGYADLIVSSYAIGKFEQAEESLPIAISIAPEDSPYMLDGLVATLRELVNFLDADKIPAIKEGIKIIDEEMARRASKRSS